MKTILSLGLSLILITSIISCGPTAAEKAAAEKATQDSIVKATEEATRKKVADEETEAANKAAIAKAIQDSVDASNQMRTQLEQELSDVNTQLKIENEKLAHIKEFKLGRTSSEKDAQIAAQYKEIQKWEDKIRELNKKLGK